MTSENLMWKHWKYTGKKSVRVQREIKKRLKLEQQQPKSLGGQKQLTYGQLASVPWCTNRGDSWRAACTRCASLLAPPEIILSFFRRQDCINIVITTQRDRVFESILKRWVTPSKKDKFTRNLLSTILMESWMKFLLEFQRSTAKSSTTEVLWMTATFSNLEIKREGKKIEKYPQISTYTKYIQIQCLQQWWCLIAH